MVQCRAKSTTTGEQCRRHAMKHPEAKGLCYKHGGAKGSGVNWEKPVQVKHARYSKSLPPDMAERYEYFKTDPDILSLKPDLALARTFLERFMATFVPGQPISADVGGELRAWSETISRVAERCNKILNGDKYSINVEGVQALTTRWAAIVAECIDSGLTGEALKTAIFDRIAKELEG